MKTAFIALVAAGAAFIVSAPANAQQKSARIGVISILNGPLALNGKEIVLGIDQAMKKLDNKIGGFPAQTFVEDAKMTVETAQLAASKLIEQNKIDFLLGNILSNQLLAYAPRATEANVIVMSSIPGPSDLAGKSCSANVFVYSWENNSPSEAVGQSMTDKGSKKAFFIAQNYVTGKEHVAGAKFYYKGDVAGEAYVPFNQTDFAAEIAQIRAVGADAVYVFMPGAAGISFIKQFTNSGLRDKVKLFGGSWLADEHSFAALGDDALGVNIAAPWFAPMDNPTNKAFVEAFRKDNGRNPVFYAAFAYDSVMALDAAVKAVGSLDDKEAIRKELAKAKFSSVRTGFGLNTNHMPIQTYYAGEVVKKDGQLQHAIGNVIFKDQKDRFYQDCKM
jgi:branched-chain amino acid transport system substrate-binding protein